jgi:hypothetical protein
VLTGDELFHVAHHDRSGRARLHPRVAGLGLAAALLGELALDGRVEIHGDGIEVVRRDPPVDPLAHATLAELLAQPHHRDVRVWLTFLGANAVDAVGQRLVVAGLMHRAVHGRWRRRVQYVPVDADRAAGVEIRLARLLTAPSAGQQGSAPPRGPLPLPRGTHPDGPLRHDRGGAHAPAAPPLPGRSARSPWSAGGGCDTGRPRDGAAIPDDGLDLGRLSDPGGRAPGAMPAGPGNGPDLGHLTDPVGRGRGPADRSTHGAPFPRATPAEPGEGIDPGHLPYPTGSATGGMPTVPGGGPDFGRPPRPAGGATGTGPAGPARPADRPAHGDPFHEAVPARQRGGADPGHPSDAAGCTTSGGHTAPPHRPPTPTDRPLPEADALLAGLIAVTGLARHVLWQPDTHDLGMARIAASVAALRPSLYHLLAFTEAAVGDAVLMPR